MACQMAGMIFLISREKNRALHNMAVNNIINVPGKVGTQLKTSRIIITIMLTIIIIIIGEWVAFRVNRARVKCPPKQ